MPVRAGGERQRLMLTGGGGQEVRQQSGGDLGVTVLSLTTAISLFPAFNVQRPTTIVGPEWIARGGGMMWYRLGSQPFHRLEVVRSEAPEFRYRLSFIVRPLTS